MLLIYQCIQIWIEMVNREKQQAYALTLASSLAGMIAKILTHPIDTIKAKLQINQMQIRHLSDVKLGTAIEIAKKTYRQQGIPGFFRGVTISVLGSTVAFSCYMSVYEYSKKRLLSNQFLQAHPTAAHLMAGFLAEVASCTFWLPIDVIKERLQVQSELKIYKYDGPRDAAKKIKSSEGIVGLYRAYGATLLFFGPFSAIFFATYEAMKDLVLKDRSKPTLSQSIICSSAAGAFAGFLTTPLEIVQRADVANNGGSLENSVFGYKNAFHGLYLMYKNQGFFALYKGALLRVFFTVPITTISMSLTEVFKQKILESHILQRWM